MSKKKIIAVCLILTAGLFVFHFLKTEYFGVRGKRVYVDDAAAQEMIGKIYEDFEQWEKAREAYEKAITEYNLPGNSYAGYRLEWIEVNSLVSAEKQKKREEISEAEYYCRVGEAYFNDNDSEKAIRYFRKAVKSGPNLDKVYFLLATALSYSGDVSYHYNERDGSLKEDAEQVLMTLLARFPDSALTDNAQFMLGRIYDYSSRNANYLWNAKKAIAGYMQLINEYPESELVQKAKKRLKVLKKPSAYSY